MQVAIGATTILLGLLSLSTAQVDLRTCGDENSDITCSFFFDKVDVAFRQSDVLYTLRKSFFPTVGAPPVLFDIFLTLEIDAAPDIRCTDKNYVFGGNSTRNPPSMNDVCNFYSSCSPYSLDWQHQWSKTILTTFIEREDLELLQNTNFFAFSAATFNNFDTSVFSVDEQSLQDDNETNSTGVSQAGRKILQFALRIEYLPCRPDSGVLLDAWEDILIWMQLYAMNSDNLENVEYTQEGRGFAFREDGNRQRGLTVPFLTIIHILINVVFALSVTYFLHKYHGELNQVKGKQYQLVASMYWSVVFLCLIGAVVIITGNCYLYYALLFIDDQSLGVFGFRIASDITVGIIVAVEFLVAMVTPHDPGFFIPHLIRRTLCCNQWCHCCGSQTGLKILRRFILGIAMWVIMVFLQLVVASLLPLAVVIITNPVPTLAYVSIMVALFFCLVVFVAYFLNAFEGNYISRHRLTREERRKSSIGLSTFARDASLAGNWIRDKLILVTQAFVFLVIFVIVALVVILYLNFVRAGANTNTAGGLFFSLIPSALLGGIAWAAKKHLFKELEEEEEGGEGDTGKKGEDTDETVFKIGGFSWQKPSTRRRKKEPAIGLSNSTVSACNTEPKENQDTVIEMEPQEDNTQAGDSKEEERNEDTDKNYTSSLEEMSEQAQAEQDGKVKSEQVKTDQDGKAKGEQSETDQDGEAKEGTDGNSEIGELLKIPERQGNGKLAKAVSMDTQEVKVPFLRDMQSNETEDTNP